MLVLFLIYLTISVIYISFFAMASAWYHTPKLENRSELKTSTQLLFLIPAFREDAVIIQTVTDLLKKQDLRLDDEIVVIADQLQENTLSLLRKLPIRVIEVHFEKSTKTKSINAALQTIQEPYGAVVLLDADNWVANDFIPRVRKAYASGFHIIQTHRVAKNTDTSFALLDAASEEINNTIFRKGHAAVGLSAALIGSGLVMDYEKFKNYLSKIEVISGFDKQLELDILDKKEQIFYLDDVYVLDEKVRNANVFEHQRTRWMAAQVHFAKKYFWKGFLGLFSNKLDFADKVLQFILPPRLFLLGGISFTWIMLLITGKFIIWISFLLVILYITIWFSIPYVIRQKIGWKEIQLIPKSFALLFLTLFRLKKAKKSFLHTPHSNSENT